MAKAMNSKRPKQPLSGWNLFYRYKRQQLIEASSRNHANTEDSVRQLIAKPAGAEFSLPVGLANAPTETLNEVRRSNIRDAMKHQLRSKSTAKRVHRKSLAFKISFNDMNKMMLAGWKAADELTKDVFQELREKGREQYCDELMKYNSEKEKHLAKSEEKKSTADNDLPIKKLKREANLLQKSFV